MWGAYKTSGCTLTASLDCKTEMPVAVGCGARQMTSEQADKLLASHESETIERKTGIIADQIAGALCCFANDYAERGVGYVIIGQRDDKQIEGLNEDPDKVSQRIATIARDICKPAIPVSIEIHERAGKRVAIVEVRKSPARPHFVGKAFVRVGSTTRQATDAEIMLLRASGANPKAAQLKRWLAEGKRTVTVAQLPALGQEMHLPPHRKVAVLEEVTDLWVTVSGGGQKQTLQMDEIQLAYDYDTDRPELRHRGRIF